MLDAIEIYLEKYNKPLYVLFSAEESNRNSLYTRMAKVLSSQYGYQYIDKNEYPPDLQYLTDVHGITILKKP